MSATFPHNLDVLKQMANFLNSKIEGLNATLPPTTEIGDISLTLESKYLRPACEALKDSPEYDMTSLQVITGTDYKDYIEVSYVLASFRKNIEAIIKIKLPKKSPEDTPEVESLCSVWKSANFQERECYDMLGVTFRHHPDLRRILCPDDWVGHPLRKDYQVQKEYNGMVVNPEEKINHTDHDFYKKVQGKAPDSKKVTFSWKERPPASYGKEGGPTSS